MKGVLVDSDVLIEVTRGRDSETLAQWDRLSGEEVLVCYSPVSMAELWHGALPRESKEMERLFDALLCLPVDAQIGRRAGEYLRQFHKSHGVELGDALIGATALLHDVALWTRNWKHYPMKDLLRFP